MNNNEIAKKFERVATLLRIVEENQYHARAYDKAARIISGAGDSFEKYVKEGVDFAPKYRGIGKGISDHVKELVETGELEKLKKLEEKVPPTLIEITKIRGVGPQTAKLVWEERGITTVDQLETAAKAGELRELKGMGKKTEENILKNIRDYRDWQDRFLLSETDSIVEALSNYLNKSEFIERFEVAGSWRRRKETVGDLDVLAVTEKKSKAMDYFTDWGKIQSIESAGETKSTVLLDSNIRVDLRILPEKQFGSALCYFTGSKAHNIHLRSIGREMGYTISEYGVFKIAEDGTKTDRTTSKRHDDERWVAGKEEKDLYEALDLPWITPELREDRGEIEAARKGKLPDLIKLSDIKGDLQMHSDWSDGNNTMEEMVEKGQNLGYEYIAITDHSKAMAMTGGLDEEKALEQAKEFQDLDEQFEGIKVLKGMEVDIMKDGSLDLSDKALHKLDVVLVSVHTHMDLSREDQTDRIVKALEGTPVNIFSHPTNRIINKRNPIEVDFEKIFEVAKDNFVALECNAQPDRLDLSDLNLKHAKQAGVKIAIDSDAHTRGHMDMIKYGIYQARRGWVEAKDVINTWELEDLRNFLDKKD